MSVEKIIELVGTSPKSWDDAMQQALTEAASSLRHIDEVELVKQTARMEEGRIVEYRVVLHVEFRLEHHGKLVGAAK
jgi:flavin-binding protein dodecin